jgi:hypothetical protein
MNGWLTPIYAQNILYNDIFPSFTAKSAMRLENGKTIRPFFPATQNHPLLKETKVSGLFSLYWKIFNEIKTT